MSVLKERLNAINEAQSIQYEPAKIVEEKETLHADSLDDNDILGGFFKTSNKKNHMEDSLTSLKEESLSEELLEAYELKRAKEEADAVKRGNVFIKAVNILLVLLCIYVIFLIYGVLMTDYKYDETGNIVPQILSVSDIGEKKAFDVILVQYENCRILYEEILMLDYRLGEGIEEPIALASEYEALLDKVEDLSIKINALDTDTKYQQIKEMLHVWISNDVAIYLQKMSSAISQNNIDDAGIALTYQTITYNDFSLISENVVTIGEQFNGVDVTAIKKWSPERYIDDTINKNK